MQLHYDPLYARSQGSHLQQLGQALRLPADDLSPEGVRQLARHILEAETSS